MTKSKPKEMELKEEHIVGYLPYKLKGMWIDVCNKERLHELVGLNIESEEVGLIAYGKNINWYSINQFKPIFYPLSDLTNPITHNGDTFVPTEKLIAGEFSLSFIKDAIKNKDYEEMLNANYKLIIKLFEWKMDVNGLIDAKLAVSVHDLPENPYK